MRSPIQSLTVSYFVHSTEDPVKIQGAAEAALDTEAPGVSEELAGHHGNRILLVTVHLTGEGAASAFASLRGRLPAEVKRAIFADLESMVDEHSALYLRLDKQALVAGKLRLGGREIVRVRVKPRPFIVRGGGAEFFRRALEEGQ